MIGGKKATLAQAMVGAVTLLMALTFGHAALAEPDVEQSSEAEAAAQAAFDEGMQLMKAGHYEQACERIAKSLELDPGMAAQFRLAECYERLGRLASAWKNYNDVAHAARAAGMRDRERFARERAAVLQSQLSTLTIVVPEEVSAIPGLRVERDGKAVASSLWNTPIPVDPGQTRVVVSAPDREPWSTQVVVGGGGGQERIDVPPFGGAPAGKEAEVDDGLSGQAIAGIVIAAVGAAAMGAGVVIGVAAKPRYDESNDHCVDNVCDAEGLDIRDSVRTQGNVATAVFVVGAAALVGGAVLWLTAPSGNAESSDDEADIAVGFGLTPGGAILRGTF